MKPVYLIFFLLIFSCSEQTLDEKISKVKTLQDIAKNNVNDSTLLYLKEAEKIIKSTPNIPDTLAIENIFGKGYYYNKINQTDSALYYFHKVIDLIKKPNTRYRNLVYFRSAWELEENQNRYANAINIAKKFVEITDEKKFPNSLLYAYNCLERIHLDLDDYSKALFYNGKTLNTARVSSNLNMYVITGNSRATTLYLHLDKKNEAFQLLDSLKLIPMDKDARRQLYRTYGILNFYEGDYQASINEYAKVLRLSKEMCDGSLDHIKKNNTTEEICNYNLLEAYNNIAEAHIIIKEYELAEKYLDSSKMHINANSFPNYINVYNEYRFKLNYRTVTNEKKLLVEYFALLEDNKKKHLENIEEKLTALKIANEKEKRILAKKNEAEIRNISLVTLLGILILLLLLGYFFYRQRKYKFEKQSLQMQQRLLRSQMSPHFMFNAISAIGNQVEKQPKEGLHHLKKFAQHMRLVLENSINDFVLLNKEIEVLKKYMELQLLRYPELFTYSISLNEIENENTLYIPPMLIQPIVENCIKHGFSNIADTGGIIEIKISKTNDAFLHCEIEDNGKGMKPLKKSNKRSSSMYLISNFLKKVTDSSFEILNKSDQDVTKTGVQISFLIPFKNTIND